MREGQDFAGQNGPRVQLFNGQNGSVWLVVIYIYIYRPLNIGSYYFGVSEATLFETVFESQTNYKK